MLLLALTPSLAVAAQLGVELTGVDNDRGLIRVAFYNEDGNGRLRRGLFGLPSEALGFSRDAPLRLGPPSFNDAAIDVADPVTRTKIKLRHISG